MLQESGINKLGKQRRFSRHTEPCSNEHGVAVAKVFSESSTNQHADVGNSKCTISRHGFHCQDPTRTFANCTKVWERISF